MSNQPNTANSSTMNEERYITEVIANEENPFGIQKGNENDRYKEIIHHLKQCLDVKYDDHDKVMRGMVQTNMDDPENRSKARQHNKRRLQIVKECQEIRREMCQLTLRVVGLCDIKSTNPDAANASMNGLTTREVMNRIISILPERISFKARTRNGRVTISALC